MRVKKYVVDNMPEAMQKIRQELGKDAVIINTKEVRIGGMMGFFTTKKIEVVAATDVVTAAPSPRALTPVADPVAVEASPLGQPDNVERVVRERVTTPQRQRSVPVFATESVLSQEPMRKAPDATWQADITEMKTILLQWKHQSETMPHDGRLVVEPAAYATVRQRLAKQEVRAEIVSALLQRASELSLRTVEEIQAHVYAQVVERMTKQPPATIRPEAKMVHLVGPTGVGKTTTIAKLAAEQTLKYRKSIAFITSDTYRIAAVDQLKTYASILDIPIEVVFSPLDLQRALTKFQDKDVIFMDTAGRNFRNEMAVSELQSLLRVPVEHDTYLVLSLTTKYPDLVAVTNHFHKFGINKVLLTKADETQTYGAVLNLLHDFPLHLSYVTDGQNVPDDIHVATAEYFAKELVGAPHDDA